MIAEHLSLLRMPQCKAWSRRAGKRYRRSYFRTNVREMRAETVRHLRHRGSMERAPVPAAQSLSELIRAQNGVGALGQRNFEPASRR